MGCSYHKIQRRAIEDTEIYVRMLLMPHEEKWSEMDLKIARLILGLLTILLISSEVAARNLKEGEVVTEKNKVGDAKFLDGDSIRLLGGGFRLLGGGYDGQSGGGGPLHMDSTPIAGMAVVTRRC
ncbi:hypothetical protein ACSQ67_017186 [Phaseolus vulgaris]